MIIQNVWGQKWTWLADGLWLTNLELFKSIVYARFDVRLAKCPENVNQLNFNIYLIFGCKIITLGAETANQMAELKEQRL